MRDQRRRKIVKMHHTLQSYSHFYISLPWILSSSLANIHLLVFGSLFLVGQWLCDWVFSGRLANTSAWLSLFKALLQQYNKFQSPESKVISQSDKEEDIVIKNKIS